MAPASTRLALRVSPGASRTAVVGRHGEAWKVRVRAPAEKGRANDELIRLLSETLSLPRTAVTLVSGHGGREKLVELVGIAPEELERRLEAAGTKGPTP